MSQSPFRRNKQTSVQRRWWTAAISALVAIGLLLGPLAPRPAQAQEGEIIHTVRPGESLSSIAERYGISYLALARRNNITNLNYLRVGQRLRIPVSRGSAPRATARPTSRPPAQPPRTAPGGAPTRRASITPSPRPPTYRPPGVTRSGEILYTVRTGDTLSSLASRYGVTMSAIMQRNRMRSYTIYVGQLLIIPQPGAAGATPRITARATPRATARPTTRPSPVRTQVTTPLRVPTAAPTAAPTATPTPRR